MTMQVESPNLSDGDLATIIRLVREHSGISLNDGKRELIVARLQKRVRQNGFRSFTQYVKHLREDQSGEELVALLDAIATNHTSFFREAQHFQLLASLVLPDVMRTARGRPIQAWSAACATGEEAYTILMAAAEAAPDVVANGGIHLLASDISTKALRVARSGLYKLERVRDVPMDLLRKYFERGLGEREGLARVSPALQRLVEFRQVNLLQGLSHRTFDFIFCRNVMIYFDRDVQQRVISMLERHLVAGGYLFISHSESLNGLATGLQWIAPAVYRQRTA